MRDKCWNVSKPGSAGSKLARVLASAAFVLAAIVGMQVGPVVRCVVHMDRVAVHSFVLDNLVVEDNVELEDMPVVAGLAIPEEVVEPSQEGVEEDRRLGVGMLPDFGRLVHEGLDKH